VSYTGLSQVEWSNKMILNDKTVVYSEGVLNESSFNIKEENVAHIFSILRSQLYSDKIGAIIREYITNAIDAHTEANVSKPITICIPCGFSNEFVVRDYGYGLSKEDVINIFASYGESTKRNSNSFTGMLGIGSKSAFAYASSFTVISRHKGIRTIYQAYIDETNVGKIAEINSQPTTESGLSVHVSIERKDINQFQNTLKEFFRYIDYRPELLGTDFDLQEPITSLTGSSWKFVEINNYNWRRTREVYFVMGNVTYKSTVEILNNQLTMDLKWLDCLNNSFLVVDVPIGKIKPSASRESLEFNELTKNYIRNILYDIKRELVNKMREKFEQCTTKYERHCVAYDLNNKFQDLTPYDIKAWIKLIDSNFASTLNTDDLKIKLINKSFPYILDKNSAYISPNTKYIVYHQAQKLTHITQRMTEYFEGLSATDPIQTLMLIKFDKQEYMDRFMNHPSVLGAEFINAESLPFTRAESTSLKSEDAKIYKFNRGRRLNLEFWQPAKTIPSENVVYVEISSFKPKQYKDNKYIDDVIDYLSYVHIKFDTPTIYGVKSSELKKVVQPDWIELKDYLLQVINEWKLNNPDKVLNYEYFKNASVFEKELISDFEYLSHLKTNLDEYYKSQTHLFNLEVALGKFDITMFEYKPPKEFEQLYSRYPFMQAFHCTMSYPDKIRLIKYLDMS